MTGTAKLYLYAPDGTGPWGNVVLLTPNRKGVLKNGQTNGVTPDQVRALLLAYERENGIESAAVLAADLTVERDAAVGTATALRATLDELRESHAALAVEHAALVEQTAPEAGSDEPPPDEPASGRFGRRSKK